MGTLLRRAQGFDVKALSIRQPWAWLIVRPDLVGQEERAAALLDGKIKIIENRNWQTNFRGRFLVHAAKGMTRAEYESCSRYALERGVFVPPMAELDRGGVVGAARITGCVDSYCVRRPDQSRWFLGEFGFVIEDAEPLQFSAVKGSLGFFNVPEH